VRKSTKGLAEFHSGENGIVLTVLFCFNCHKIIQDFVILDQFRISKCIAKLILVTSNSFKGFCTFQLSIAKQLKKVQAFVN